MEIKSRIKLYKSLFGADCKALEAVKGFILPTDKLEALEAIRGLNTVLSDLYMVSIPTLTVWVRDNSYVQATGEISYRARAGGFSPSIPPSFTECGAEI